MNLDIREITKEIFQLYDRHGAEQYIGEAISQIEHMAQSAQLAWEGGYDDEVILAAFFHDIGHLCVQGNKAPDMGSYGVHQHEKIGADYLRQKGFSEKIAQLVENHVKAKRYLTWKYPAYYEQLSEASKQTLEYQGGRMDENEAIEFKQDPLFHLSIQMREWDEMAKEENVPLPDLEAYQKMCQQHLQEQNGKATTKK